MKRTKYQNIDYWRSKIEDSEELWSGLFESTPINQESLIIAPTILDSYRNIHEEGFAVYPNPKSVLGFLQYIYLPTAFNNLLDPDESSSDYYIYDEDLTELFNNQKLNHPDKIEHSRKMESFYNELNHFWDLSDEQCLDNLIMWTESFNGDWLDIKYIGLTFTIFTSPRELAKEFIRVYEEDLDIEMLENDLGISEEEFIKISGDEIFTNEFMKRRFTDILTNRLPVTL